MFILSAQYEADDSEPAANWERYQTYVAQNRERFPRSALELATSRWYYDFNDPRCPHDAWLEQALILEPARGERQEIRTVALRLRLLGAYHNGHIELFYPEVFRYQLNLYHGADGHRDWCCDEFRLTDAGHLLHEIEWWSMGESARWIIEASDVEFTWTPCEQAAPPA